MAIKQIDSTLIAEKLIDDNPWWSGKGVWPRFTSLKHRLYFDSFYRLSAATKPRRAMVLMGPRRVGKTVMIYQTIHKLLAAGVNPRSILYVSVDKPIYSSLTLLMIISLYQDGVSAKIDPNAQYYLFFDEIQYLEDWPRELKSLVDDYPNVKFIASGSAAAALAKSSAESGAGRFTDFVLPPLTFAEYVHLKDYQHMLVGQGSKIKALNISEFNHIFIEYVTYGGFPEVVLDPKVKEDMQRYIGEDIVERALIKDLPQAYGIRNTGELQTLFNAIAFNTSHEFSRITLASQILKDENKSPKVDRYIEYLEAAHLIKKVSRVDITAKRFKREDYYKLYLQNPSMYTALFGSPKPDNLGGVIETAVFSQYLHRDYKNLRYCNWKKPDAGEVDLVNIHPGTQKPKWAVEVKWTDHPYKKSSQLKSLNKFLKKHPNITGWVTTQTVDDQSDERIKFIPTAIFTYLVGDNALRES